MPLDILQSLEKEKSNLILSANDNTDNNYKLAESLQDVINKAKESSDSLNLLSSIYNSFSQNGKELSGNIKELVSLFNSYNDVINNHVRSYTNLSQAYNDNIFKNTIRGAGIFKNELSEIRSEIEALSKKSININFSIDKSNLNSIPRFQTGGLVTGGSKTGDKILARLNAGEWVLNENQMNNLSNMLSHKTGKRMTPTDVFKMLGGSGFGKVDKVGIPMFARGGSINNTISNIGNNAANAIIRNLSSLSQEAIRIQFKETNKVNSQNIPMNVRDKRINQINQDYQRRTQNIDDVLKTISRLPVEISRNLGNIEQQIVQDIAKSQKITDKQARLTDDYSIQLDQELGRYMADFVYNLSSNLSNQSNSAFQSGDTKRADTLDKIVGILENISSPDLLNLSNSLAKFIGDSNIDISQASIEEIKELMDEFYNSTEDGKKVLDNANKNIKSWSNSFEDIFDESKRTLYNQNASLQDKIGAKGKIQSINLINELKSKLKGQELIDFSNTLSQAKLNKNSSLDDFYAVTSSVTNTIGLPKELREKIQFSSVMNQISSQKQNLSQEDVEKLDEILEQSLDAFNKDTSRTLHTMETLLNNLIQNGKLDRRSLSTTRNDLDQINLGNRGQQRTSVESLYFITELAQKFGNLGVGLENLTRDLTKMRMSLARSAWSGSDIFQEAGGLTQFGKELNLTKRELASLAPQLEKFIRNSDVQIGTIQNIAKNLKEANGVVDPEMLNKVLSSLQGLTQGQINAITGLGPTTVSDVFGSAFALMENPSQLDALIEAYSTGAFGGEAPETLEGDKAFLKAQQNANVLLETINNSLSTILNKYMPMLGYFSILTSSVQSGFVIVKTIQTLQALKAKSGGGFDLMNLFSGVKGGPKASSMLKGAKGAGIVAAALGTLQIGSEIISDLTVGNAQSEISKRKMAYRRSQNMIGQGPGGAYFEQFDKDKIAKFEQYQKYGKLIGGVTGGIIGAAAGGAVGSAIAPGVGTVAGGVVGGIVGNQAGEWVGGKTGELLFDLIEGTDNLSKSEYKLYNVRKKMMETNKRAIEAQFESLKSLKSFQTLVEQLKKGQFTKFEDAMIESARRQKENMSVIGGSSANFQAQTNTMMMFAGSSFEKSMNIISKAMANLAQGRSVNGKTTISGEYAMAAQTALINEQIDVTKKWISTLEESIGEYLKIPESILSGVQDKINKSILQINRIGGGSLSGFNTSMEQTLRLNSESFSANMQQFVNEIKYIEKARVKHDQMQENMLRSLNESGNTNYTMEQVLSSDFQKMQKERVVSADDRINEILSKAGYGTEMATHLSRAELSDQIFNLTGGEETDFSEVLSFFNGIKDIYREKEALGGLNEEQKDLFKEINESLSSGNVSNNDIDNLKRLTGILLSDSNLAAQKFRVENADIANQVSGYTKEKLNAGSFLSFVSSDKIVASLVKKQLEGIVNAVNQVIEDNKTLIEMAKNNALSSIGRELREVAEMSSVYAQRSGNNAQNLLDVVNSSSIELSNQLKSLTELSEKQEKIMSDNEKRLDDILESGVDSLKLSEEQKTLFSEYVNAIKNREKAKVGIANGEVGSKESFEYYTEIIERLSKQIDGFGIEQKQLRISLDTAGATISKIVFDIIKEQQQAMGKIYTFYDKIIQSLKNVETSFSRLADSISKLSQGQATLAMKRGFDLNQVNAIGYQSVDATAASFDERIKRAREMYEKLNSSEGLKNLRKEIMKNNPNIDEESLKAEEKRVLIESARNVVDLENQQLQAVKESIKAIREVGDKIIGLRTEEVNLKKSIAEIVGAPIGTIISLERENAKLANQRYLNSVRAYQKGLEQFKEGRIGVDDLQELKNDMLRADKDRLQAIIGAQRSALEKMLGRLVGSFQGSAGMRGASLYSKLGAGLTMTPQGQALSLGVENLGSHNSYQERIFRNQMSLLGNGLFGSYLPVGKRSGEIPKYNSGNNFTDLGDRVKSALSNLQRAEASGDSNAILRAQSALERANKQYEYQKYGGKDGKLIMLESIYALLKSWDQYWRNVQLNSNVVLPNSQGNDNQNSNNENKPNNNSNIPENKPNNNSNIPENKPNNNSNIPEYIAPETVAREEYPSVFNQKSVMDSFEKELKELDNSYHGSGGILEQERKRVNEKYDKIKKGLENSDVIREWERLKQEVYNTENKKFSDEEIEKEIQRLYQERKELNMFSPSASNGAPKIPTKDEALRSLQAKQRGKQNMARQNYEAFLKTHGDKLNETLHDISNIDNYKAQEIQAIEDKRNNEYEEKRQEILNRKQQEEEKIRSKQEEEKRKREEEKRKKKEEEERYYNNLFENSKKSQSETIPSLEKELEKAKKEGNSERVSELERKINKERDFVERSQRELYLRGGLGLVEKTLPSHKDNTDNYSEEKFAEDSRNLRNKMLEQDIIDRSNQGIEINEKDLPENQERRLREIQGKSIEKIKGNIEFFKKKSQEATRRYFDSLTETPEDPNAEKVDVLTEEWVTDEKGNRKRVPKTVTKYTTRESQLAKDEMERYQQAADAEREKLEREQRENLDTTVRFRSSTEKEKRRIVNDRASDLGVKIIKASGNEDIQLNYPFQNTMRNLQNKYQNMTENSNPFFSSFMPDTKNLVNSFITKGVGFSSQPEQVGLSVVSEVPKEPVMVGKPQQEKKQENSNEKKSSSNNDVKINVEVHFDSELFKKQVVQVVKENFPEISASAAQRKGTNG